MCHKLHIDKNYKLVKQKPKRAAPEKARAIEEEIHKLIEAGVISDAKFPEWISNPVVINKNNE